MKVLGVCCSPRLGGNSDILVHEALKGARSMGAEVDFWTTAEKKNLQPCDACQTCFETWKCRIDDDFQELYPKVLVADGIIFASGTHFRTINAQGKLTIDRLYWLYITVKLVNKIAGCISVSQSIGNESTLEIWHKFIDLCHMFKVDDVWSFGVPIGDVKRYEYGMKASFELGKEIARLAKKKLEWPEENKMPLYRVVSDIYGIECTPTFPTGKRE
jgi:multimeric flavodoxin WrbA